MPTLTLPLINFIGSDSNIDPYNPVNHGIAKGLVRVFWKGARPLGPPPGSDALGSPLAPSGSPLAPSAREHVYTFTEDWFSHNIPTWTRLLSRYAGQPDVMFIEVGSFQGRSAVWLMQNVLTHPTSRLTCIDTFGGSVEHSDAQKDDLFGLFSRNIAPYADRITVRRGRSQAVMRMLAIPLWDAPDGFDFAYIDGDHHAPSVLEDAVLAFGLLKVGGVMIFDDYEWAQMPREVDMPRMAVDAFVRVYADKLRVLDVGYQFAIQKTK